MKLVECTDHKVQIGIKKQVLEMLKGFASLIHCNLKVSLKVCSCSGELYSTASRSSIPTVSYSLMHNV